MPLVSDTAGLAGWPVSGAGVLLHALTTQIATHNDHVFSWLKADHPTEEFLWRILADARLRASACPVTVVTHPVPGPIADRIVEVVGQIILPDRLMIPKLRDVLRGDL